MLATASDRPSGANPAWAVEFKWDGARAITQTSPSGTRIFSRTRRDITTSFPEIATALPDRDLILDGEIVAPDVATGVPDFGRLQRRLGAVPTAIRRASVPVQYLVFDALAVDGTFVMDRPYLERRALLDGLGLAGGPIVVPPTWVDEDPARLLEVAEEQGIEGVVLKRVDSIYLPGRRSRLWLKHALRKSATLVVVGWLEGSRRGVLGSVLVAGRLDGQLQLAGAVGSGFTSAGRRALQGALEELAREDSPLDVEPPREVARVAHWASGRILVDVNYREMTAEGVLRQPSFRGVRTDATLADLGWPD